MASQPPLGNAPLFVGRAAELAQVVDGISAGASAYVIAGPAGVGKTRLAGEVSRYFVEQGYAQERLLATRAIRSVPFGAFVPVLPHLEAGDRLTMLREATASIAARGGDARLVLTIEDAHLLDDGSAALLLQLVMGHRCTVIVTLRTPADTPGPVTELWKDQLAQRLDLKPLSGAHVDVLAESILGGPVSPTTARWLAKKSAGNPMYVRELLLSAAEHDALFQQEGLWFLRPPLPAADRLAELVASRLENLADQAMDVVDLLALGEPLPYDLLETLAGEAAIVQAEQAGIVDAADRLGMTARLAHPLYSEIRRQRMPHERLRQLSQSLVDNFQLAEDAGREETIRIARWQMDAGGPGDPELLSTAASFARKVYDFDLAIDLGQSAIAAGAGPMAALAVAEAYFFSGRPDEAETVLANAAQHCTTETESARIAHARVYNLGIVKGDQAAAEAVLDNALARTVDKSARTRLVVSKVTLKIWTRSITSVLSEAEALIESDEPGVSDRGLFFAGIVSAACGRLSNAKEYSAKGTARSKANGEPDLSHLVGMIMSLRAAGELSEADRLVSATYDLPSGLEATATMELLHGLVMIERGAPARAEQLFRDALAINRELRDPGPLRWCLGGIALSQAQAGNRRAARSALAEIDGLPTHVMTFFDNELIDRGRAWTMALDGDLSGARALLRNAADEAGSDARWVSEMFLRHDLVRLGSSAVVVARLAELTELVEGHLVEVMARHAAAVTAGSEVRELETVANLFEQLGSMLVAAEVGTAVCERFRRDGDERQAHAWSNHVERLRDLCGPVDTPALELGTAKSLLTRREREIAVLAAGGASSRDIAKRLVLSVRTVENHLQRVYAKLGVTAREELADHLPAERRDAETR